jgi:hypothetical protein
MFPPLPYPGGSRRFGFYRAAARQRRVPAFFDDFSATSDAAPSGGVKQLQVPHGALGRAGTLFCAAVAGLSPGFFRQSWLIRDTKQNSVARGCGDSRAGAPSSA